MKPIFGFLLAAGLLLSAGCSTAPVRVNTGAVHATTFSFVTGRPMPPDYAEQRAPLQRLVQNAIITNLTAKGLSRAPAGGDVFVACLLIRSNNVSTAAVNEYFGYSRSADTPRTPGPRSPAGPNHPSGCFAPDTLLVDIIDAKTYKLLYRNYTVRPDLGELAEDANAGPIQAAVDQTLRGLRITH